MASFSKSSSDIQENINILLEGYPLLKVFSQPIGFDIFSEANFDIINLFADMYFKINFAGGKAVSVSPYIMHLYSYNGNAPTPEQEQEARQLLPLYLKHKALIESYIRYQLINSGVLDFLPNVPIRQHRSKFYKRIKDPTAKYDFRWEPSPEFETSIVIKLNPGKTSITSTNYHNDSTLFQILQYDQSDRLYKPYVLGSELLFYHEEDDNIRDNTNIHGKLAKDASSKYVFPTEIMGELISEKHNLAKKIYETIKAEGLSPPLLRNKLHHGDTAVFPDTLWKHAVIDPKEKREPNIIHIELATTSGNMSLDVNVCADRIPTNNREYEGRKIIGLSCTLFENYLEPQFLLEPFSLLDDGPTKIELPIPAINFNEAECIVFLSQLSRGNGCITITDIATETSAVILNRGGTKHRKTNKIRKKANKKRRTNKRRNPRKKYIKCKIT